MGQTQAECSDNVATSSGHRGTKVPLTSFLALQRTLEMSIVSCVACG